MNTNLQKYAANFILHATFFKQVGPSKTLKCSVFSYYLRNTAMHQRSGTIIDITL